MLTTGHVAAFSQFRGATRRYYVSSLVGNSFMPSSFQYFNVSQSPLTSGGQWFNNTSGALALFSLVKSGSIIALHPSSKLSILDETSETFKFFASITPPLPPSTIPISGCVCGDNTLVMVVFGAGKRYVARVSLPLGALLSFAPVEASVMNVACQL